jgi:GNAT superfamily N-acetyltransferase
MPPRTRSGGGPCPLLDLGEAGILHHESAEAHDAEAGRGRSVPVEGAIRPMAPAVVSSTMGRMDVGHAPTGSPPVDIRDARVGDRRAVVDIFADSFRDFPPLASIVGTDAGADGRRRRMMQATLAVSSSKLHVLVAVQDGRVVGALTYADSPACTAVTGFQARTYLRVYGRRLPAMARSVIAILRMHPRTPHRHLPMVGVDPARWGEGIGGLLLSEYCRRCDEAGLPGYLETVRYARSGRPSHERLYGRHGFHVEHVAALDPEWSLLGMTRPVGSSDSEAAGPRGETASPKPPPA